MAAVSIIRASYTDFDLEALLAPLGGMAPFVQANGKILLKVNLLSAKTPAQAVTTHPEFVRTVARAVKSAGGVPYIGDSPAGPFTKRILYRAYRLSGLAKMADEEAITLNRATGAQKVRIPNAKRLKKAPICDFMLRADKVIGLPKLKTHSFQFLTLACKNMFGVVPGLAKAKYHARFPQRESFADMILDLLAVAKPQLFIMDGIDGMQGQGPGSGDPIEMKLALASADPVAMDIAVCRIIGIEPVGVPVLKRAKVRGLWPRRIDYPLLRPEDVACKRFRLPNTASHIISGRKPPSRSPVITNLCTACGACADICPPNAIQMKARMPAVTYSRCIRCFCCHEVCPEDAIVLRRVKSH